MQARLAVVSAEKKNQQAAAVKPLTSARRSSGLFRSRQRAPLQSRNSDNSGPMPIRSTLSILSAPPRVVKAKDDIVSGKEN